MSLKGLKRERSATSHDIICILPTELVECIFRKMTICDAVRTSALSKEWRFYYLTIPELIFDEEFSIELKHFVRNYSPEFVRRFDEIVTNSLLIHRCPIERFEVCIPNFNSWKVIDVSKWIDCLSYQNIKKLTLKHKKYDMRRITLPPNVFDCVNLTYLELQNYVLLPPQEFKGFRNLVHLILTDVALANNCFESIISGCPAIGMIELRWCSGVDHFYISDSNLKSLLIRGEDDGECKSICLTNARRLTYLKLQNVVLLPPLKSEAFPNLSHLILTKVDLAKNSLESILSGCKVLQRLELHRCFDIHHFKISGSSLKSLYIEADTEFKSISLDNARHLTDVSVTLDKGVRGLEDDPVSDLVMFMDKLLEVKMLHLNKNFLQILAAGVDEVPMRLPFDLNNVIHFHLSDICLEEDELDVVLCALCMIRSFPYLQCLEIEVDKLDDEISALESLEVERFEDLTFNHLKEVKLENITGTKPQMQLIELLLAKSPVLERLRIVPFLQPLDRIVKMLSELTEFQRASPKAEVVYDIDKHPNNS